MFDKLVNGKSPLELSDILSALPNYLHNQFMVICSQELSDRDYQEFLKHLEKNKLF